MGTISGMGFAQAQVHTNHSTSAEGTSAVMYARDCPHGEVAFSNSNINKKQCTIKICQITSFMSTMGK